MKITVQTIVQAPIDVVWNAYTTPEAIVEWNAASDDWHTTHAAVNLVVGGTFTSRMEAKDGSVGFDFAGIYTLIEPQHAIEYAFGDRVARVTFSTLPSGSIQVQVQFDAETENSEEMQRTGWQAILDNFARYVQSIT